MRARVEKVDVLGRNNSEDCYETEEEEEAEIFFIHNSNLAVSKQNLLRGSSSTSTHLVVKDPQ